MTVALIDDQALSAVLRGRTARPLGGRKIATTGCWYVRLCQAALAASERTGMLSSPFANLSEPQRVRAINSLIELPDEIELLSLRHLGRVIGRLRSRHSLNLLAAEALAAATALEAEVFLSAPSPKLEVAIVAEGRRWNRLPGLGRREQEHPGPS